MEAFARATNGNAHIIVVGRNEAKAHEVISTFPKPTALGAKHEFIQCDATLMKNVHAATNDILARVDRINFIVMTTAYLGSLAPSLTEEGLERKLTAFFYARIKFTVNLLGALENAARKGEQATVLNVAAGAQMGERLDVTDVGMAKAMQQGFGALSKLRSQVPTYHNLAFEVSASRATALHCMLRRR